MEESLEDVARSLTEDQDQSESDEDRYTFGTEEGEGGLTPGVGQGMERSQLPSSFLA